METSARVRELIDGGVRFVDPSTVYIDGNVTIGAGTKIGPGVILRGDVVIGQNCRVTNYVEIKQSTIGDGTKISHMTYIGDAVVGKNCNIGCGVVFCNYDGREKHQTTIGDGVFIGSNVNLVAPVTIGDGAFIAAGSTITDDVPEWAFAIARGCQSIVDKWNDGGRRY